MISSRNVLGITQCQKIPRVVDVFDSVRSSCLRVLQLEPLIISMLLELSRNSYSPFSQLLLCFCLPSEPSRVCLGSINVRKKIKLISSRRPPLRFFMVFSWSLFGVLFARVRSPFVHSEGLRVDSSCV